MSRKPLHIGYVLGRYPVLSETFILRELLALQSMGLRLTIYTFGGSPDDICHGDVEKLHAPVHYLPEKLKRLHIAGAFFYWAIRRPGRLWAALRCSGGGDALRASFGALFLASRAKRDPPDHVHVHYLSTPADAAGVMADLLDVPFSVSAHAHDIFLSTENELKSRLNRADWVRTISRYNRDYLRSLVPSEFARTIEVIRAGIDLDKLPFRSSSIDIDSSETIHIVTVGRLVEIKGMDILISALSLITEYPWKLSIAGGGPLLKELQELVGEMNLDSRILFLGPQNELEIADLLGNAQLFVLACRRDRAGNMDGIPSVLTEAMARGVPTISTTISGIPEILGGGAGILVPSEDSEALAEAMIRAISDHTLRESLVARGRARVERGYDIEKTTRFLASRFGRYAKPAAAEAQRS